MLDMQQMLEKSSNMSKHVLSDQRIGHAQNILKQSIYLARGLQIFHPTS